MHNRIRTITTTPAGVRPCRRFRAANAMVRLTPRQISELREIDPQLSLTEALQNFIDAMLDTPAPVDQPIAYSLAEGGAT